MATGGGGQQNLGSAQYTVTANTAQFNQGMQQAQVAAQSASTQIVSALSGLGIMPRQLAAINQSIMAVSTNLAALSLRAASTGRSLQSMGGQGAFGGMGMGILYVSQAIDDVQYGFQSIVNNIPQLAMAVGGAMGLSTQATLAWAGALQIAGVAGQYIGSHWKEWFGSAERMPELAEGADNYVKSLHRIADALDKLIEKQEAAAKASKDAMEPGNLGNFFHMFDSATSGFNAFDQEKMAKLQQLQKEGKQAAADENLMKGAGPEHTEAARKTAKAFREAVLALPEGSDTLMGALVANGMKGGDARKAIAGALRGNAGHLDDIVKALPDDLKRGMFSGVAASTPEAQAATEQRRLDMEGVRRNRQAADKVKEEDAKRVDELNKQGRENQEAMKRDQEREKTWDLQDKRELLQERRAAIAKEPKPFTGDYMDYIKKVQESALEQQKLQRLEAIDKEIKKTNEILKAKQREAARAG
jgi:hypothetical protein